MSRLVLLTVLLAACGGKKSPEASAEEPSTTAPADADTEADTDAIVRDTVPEPTDPDLAFLGRRWEMVTMEGATLETGSDQPVLFFQVDPGTPPNLTGYAGCNRFYGTAFSATAETIHFGTVGSTRRACPALPLEQKFLGMLHEAESWSIVDDMLVVSAADRTLFTFREGEAEQLEVTE